MRIAPRYATTRPSRLFSFLAVGLLAFLGAGCAGVIHERDVKAASLDAVTPEERASVDAVITASVARCVTIRPTPEIFGSGALISDDGWILTAEHVTLGKKTVRVTLASGDEMEGRVIAVSQGAEGTPGNDYALLKVQAKGLPFFRLSPRRPLIGERVIAVGTSVKFSAANASVGKVIYPKIRLPGKDGLYYYDAIFHKAPIDHGDSGGPLVDARGDLVGIHGGFAGQGASTADANGPHGGIATAIVEILKRLPNKGILSGSNLGESDDPAVFPIPWPAAKPRDFTESAEWTARSLEETLVVVMNGDRAAVQEMLSRAKARYVALRATDPRGDADLVRAMLHDIFDDLQTREPAAVASSSGQTQ